MCECLYEPNLLSGLTFEAGLKGLTKISFGRGPDGTPGPCVHEAAKQVREYLSGGRVAFDIPLDPRGTPFQLQVWQALMAIPYGQTCSYRDIAVAVNRPKGFQAIGQANHRNPIPIIIPCHRVIAADGTIGGYGGGLDRKRQLLALESRSARPALFSLASD